MKPTYRNLSFLGFPDYKVGTDGIVWSCRPIRPSRKEEQWWKRLRGGFTAKGSKGYRVIDLHNSEGCRTFLVHRLVLLAFVGPCPEGKEGAHDDGNPQHNELSNLRWKTLSANQLDRLRHGTSIRGGHLNQGERNHWAKITADTVRKIRREHIPHTPGKGIVCLGRKYNLDPTAVWAIIKRINWRHIA